MKLTFEQNYTIRRVLIAVLNSGKSNVTFLKSDNTIRKMVATRDEAHVGDAFNNPHTVSAEAVKVYDVEEADYRTFRIDSLIEINGIPLTTLVALASTTV